MIQNSPLSLSTGCIEPYFLASVNYASPSVGRHSVSSPFTFERKRWNLRMISEVFNEMLTEQDRAPISFLLLSVILKFLPLV